VREAAARDGVRLGGLAPPDIARLVKAVPVRLTGVAGIARAISTAGGVSFEEVDGNFMLRKLPGVFVAGEMLDWDAPTGGYLLQAAFATGVAAAAGAIAWVAGADSNIDLAAHAGRTVDPTLPPNNVQARLIGPARRHILRLSASSSKIECTTALPRRDR
jgi:hypothetical protein